MYKFSVQNSIHFSIHFVIHKGGYKMKIITIMNNKGGESTTTTALSLLAGLTDRA